MGFPNHGNCWPSIDLEQNWEIVITINQNLLKSIESRVSIIYKGATDILAAIVQLTTM